MKKDPVRERAVELAGGIAAWKKSPMQHHFDRMAQSQLDSEAATVGVGEHPHAPHDLHVARIKRGTSR